MANNKTNKLTFRFHNPNTPEDTLNFVSKIYAVRLVEKLQREGKYIITPNTYLNSKE